MLPAGTAGGCEHHVLRLLTRLDRSRFQPWLAVFEARPDAARSLLHDFRAAGVRVVALSERGRYDPRVFLRYGRLLRSVPFALVHTHALRADLATLPWLWRLRPRPRLVRTVHNTDPHLRHPILGPLARLSLARYDAVIAISDAVAAYLQARVGLAPPRLRRVYYGLEPGDQPEVATPTPAGRRVLLVVARIARQKGQDVLVRALPALVREFPDVDVWLAGHETGESAASLRDLAARLGVADRVRLLGFREDARTLMRQATIVVLPSRWEGFGLVLLEAMAAARPVVASAVGAIPEVVEDGATGLLVPPDDPEALARALGELLRAPSRAAAMGRAGRQRLVARFGEREMIEATQALYNAVLGPAAAASQR